MYDVDFLTPDELALLDGIECTSSDKASEIVPYRPELDWSGVAASVIAEAHKAAVRIRARHGTMIDSVLETGADLLRIKAMLGHGKFGPWLKAEFGWTARTAENYMSVAREFDGKPEFARTLPQKLLYDLAAKSVPAALRQEIIAEAEAGKALEEADIRRRIAQAKEAPRAKRGKSMAVKSEGSDPSSSQEADAAMSMSMSSSGPGAAMSSTTDAISAEVTTPAEDPRSTEDAIASDRERVEQEQAAKVVRYLQQKLGEKYAGFRTVVQSLTPSVFMEALRAAPPISGNAKGDVINLPTTDYSRAPR